MIRSFLGEDITIDIAKLKEADIALLAKALSDNNKEITRRINAKTKECLQKGEITGCEPTFMTAQEFQNGPRWHAFLWAKIGQDSAKGSTSSMLFPIAVYLYEAYGVSPSKLLLGAEAKTMLPAWLQNWLGQVATLSASEYNRLYDILESGEVTRCDIVYVLKSRLAEMAAACGAPPDDFILYPGLLATDFSNVNEFSKASFRETGNPYRAMKPFIGNHKMLRLLICMCVRYQVSPEYLLLQDYSEFAVTEQGRYYPPATRQLVSLLLRVDAQTRLKAIGFVMAASAAQVMIGAPTPVAVAGEPSKDAPMNLMEAMASSKTTKKKAEEQIVSALKDKVMDVLALSMEPVSSTKIFSLAAGHSRMVRKALSELEEEGQIACLPMPRGAAFWQIKK